MNFENKLKGLETRPDYPKEKQWYYRAGRDTSTDYNMISNLPLSDHHYAEPAKRPGPDPPQKLRGKMITNPGLREYNIVTNRYLQ